MARLSLSVCYLKTDSIAVVDEENFSGYRISMEALSWRLCSHQLLFTSLLGEKEWRSFSMTKKMLGHRKCQRVSRSTKRLVFSAPRRVKVQ